MGFGVAVGAGVAVGSWGAAGSREGASVRPVSWGELVAPICRAPRRSDCSKEGSPAEGTEMEAASPQPVSSTKHMPYEIIFFKTPLFIQCKNRTFLGVHSFSLRARRSLPEAIQRFTVLRLIPMVRAISSSFMPP